LLRQSVVWPPAWVNGSQAAELEETLSIIGIGRPAMARRITGFRTLIATLGLCGLIAVVFLGSRYIQFRKQVGISYFRFRKDVRRATPYRPDCSERDSACAIWKEFRRAHPYPYQTIAAKRSSDASLVLILSEPSPSLTKRQLDQLVGTVFGSDLLSSQRLRWYIGTDGWVEDLVLKTKFDLAPEFDPLRSARLRDRLALLYQALFGTPFGGDLELINKPLSASTRGVAPNINPSPSEVRSWLEDRSLSWQPLNTGELRTLTWPTIRD
jgi:hypothetical protein